MNLSKNKIGAEADLATSLEPLNSLASLTNLDLSGLGNIGTDQALASIKDLVNLEYLTLDDIDISLDLSHISGMTKLRSLKYTTVNDNVLDISVLSNFKDLTYLDLYGFKLLESSEQVFENLKSQIEDLAISYFDEPWLGNALAKMDNIVFLDITYAMHQPGQFTGLSFLSNMEQVEFLTLRASPFGFSNSRKADISSLENLVNLLSLNLENIGLVSSEPLRNLTKLETINILGVNDDFIDANVMSSLIKLESLSIVGTSVGDTSFFNDLTGLQVIELNNTDVDSLDSFSALNRLEYLDIEDSKISSLEPIKGLTQLKYILARNSDVVCKDVEEMVAASPATEIDGIKDCQL